MSKYKVLYIDEQEEERELFEQLEDSSLEILTMHPYPSEEEMMKFIWSDNFDAVVVDYGLMKGDPNIKYNGSDILFKINEEREDFPALIFTQDLTQDNGVDEIVPSTKILLKDDLERRGTESIRRKIKSYIKFYQRENEQLSRELNELIAKRRKQDNHLSDADLERLNYLDTKIERRLNGKRMFPNLLKNSKNFQELNELIKKAENFLNEKMRKS